MSVSGEDIEVIELAAAQWAVRSLDDAFGDSDVAALVAWLEESPRHAEAYDRATRLWTDLDALRDTDIVQPGAEVIRLSGRRRSDPMRLRLPAWGLGGAVAAALAAAVAIPLLMSHPIPAQVYATAKGERRQVALADGSQLMLNTDTRVSVRLGAHGRDLVLDHGEVALKVTHDAARPLTLHAGDQRVTDLGTEFDVLRSAGAVRIAVREGEVRLEDGQTLRAGDTSLHREGQSGNALGHAAAEEAFAWQTAHAIYRNQPLSVVVGDLNRYFDKPLIVDADSGNLRLTAILTLDSETSVVERLQDFLPLAAKTTDKGIYLSRAAHPGRGNKL